jgi:hypothetical protein
MFPQQSGYDFSVRDWLPDGKLKVNGFEYVPWVKKVRAGFSAWIAKVPTRSSTLMQ